MSDLAERLGNGHDVEVLLAGPAMSVPAAELRGRPPGGRGDERLGRGRVRAVEQGIEDGQPGDGVKEWVTAAFGTARLIMAVALRDQDAGAASTAATALMLIMIRTGLKAVHQLMPDANFDVLENPMIVPSFLVGFLSR